MRSRKTIATPPGATIKEQLNTRGMTQKEFAKRMDMSEKHISHLVNGEVRLSQDVAQRLESVLGLPAEFWNNLESRFREKLARVELENAIDEDQEIAKEIPYNEMSKYHWVPETRTASERVMNLRKFFSVARLDVLESLMIPGIAYRRTEVKENHNYALAAWAQKARIEASNIEVAGIDIKRLNTIIPRIRAMTTKNPEEFCPELEGLLTSCGIALVLLPHMKGTCLHGATFPDGNKIVMGLTVRGCDADRFWFSLFHEIGHILSGHINRNGEATPEEEDIADVFSANTLIPESSFLAFIEQKDFSAISIKAFATQIDIDPGIVVGRLQKSNYIGYNQCNTLKTKYKLVN